MSKLPRFVLAASFFLFFTFIFATPSSASEYSWEHLSTFPAEVYDFDSDPFDASVLYAALSNGLYKSTDGGISWFSFAFEGRMVSAVAINPQDPSILYTGVHDEEGNGYGLYRFSDGVWSDSILDAGSYIKQIYVDRVHPRIIYVAIGSRIYRSYDGGNSWAVGDDTNYLYEFAVSLSDPFKIYAAAGTCGLCKSDDGGATWTGCRSNCASFTTSVENVDVDPFGELAVYSQRGGGPTFPNCLFRWVGEGPSATLYRRCRGGDVLFNPYVRGEVFFAGTNSTNRRFVKRSSESGDENTWQNFGEGLPSAYPGPYISDFFIHNAAPYLYALSGRDLYWSQVGPTVVVNRPVILVPGMGASFNPFLFFGHGPDDWAWTPGVQVYDGLLASLEHAGYVRDRNLFVAFYDWRAPMMESSCEYLKPMIEGALALSGADKVMLVGHSQGGLLSRAYIQGNCYGGDVEKLVTVGTPHMGAADAYFAWEGIDFRGYGGFANFFLRLWLSLKQYYEKAPSKIYVLHNFMPSLKEIFPVYDFLKRNGDLVAWDSLHEVNNLLPTLNSDLLYLLSSVDLTTISGGGNEASEFIKVTERSEAVGDKWLDGQPIDLNPIEFGDGDGRVLKSSSLVGGAGQQVAEDLNHGELIGLKAGQQTLFSSLGIELEESQFVESPPFDAVLGFFLGSPATFLITDSEGNKVGYDPETGEYVNELNADIWGENEEEKWVVIPNPDSDEYNVEIFPLDGGGVYHLFASYESYQSQGQEETVGEVGEGEEDMLTFVLSPKNVAGPIRVEDPEGEVALEEIKAQSAELRTQIEEWDLPEWLEETLFQKIIQIEKDSEKAQSQLEGAKPGKVDIWVRLALLKVDLLGKHAGEFYSEGYLTEEQLRILGFYLAGLGESISSFLSSS